MATITALFRYPVKSLAGEALESVTLTELGVMGDRRYAFADSAPERAGKALTARQLHAMLTYRARLSDGGVIVSTPGGASLEATSDALLSELEKAIGRPLALREAVGSNFDTSPLLLLNLASVRAFAETVGRELDARRFRANVWLEGLPPFAERAWLGRRLQAGAATLEGVLMCERCMMITLDPDTLERDPRILRELVATQDHLMGLYCRVTGAGRVAVGDIVEPL